MQKEECNQDQVDVQAQAHRRWINQLLQGQIDSKGLAKGFIQSWGIH